MTRLDAGVVKLRQEWIDPVEVLDTVHERVQRRMGARKLTLDAPAAAPSILVDPLLLEQAIINVIENSLAYTPAKANVRLGAEYTTSAVSIWVEDEGPGVPVGDLPFIFDKFHRLKNAEDSQGAGLGLAISKGFVEAMGGEARASTAEGGGLRVAFIFPLQMSLAPV
jgi:two-component system sensor histidine kinase KdpD